MVSGRARLIIGLGLDLFWLLFNSGLLKQNLSFVIKRLVNFDSLSSSNMSISISPILLGFDIVVCT